MNCKICGNPGTHNFKILNDEFSICESCLKVLTDIRTHETMKTLQPRKEAFAKKLSPYLEKYGRDMLNDFYRYWTEHNEHGRKMRFEQQKVFNISQRLITWNNKKHERIRGNKKGFDSSKTEATIKSITNAIVSEGGKSPYSVPGL